jgi:hypothetical protein
MTALNRPPSDISWIGSIQVFLLFFIGTFTGRLTDAGYFRQVFMVGSFIGGKSNLFLNPLKVHAQSAFPSIGTKKPPVFGLFMASLSTTYWQLFLAQGKYSPVSCFRPSLARSRKTYSTAKSKMHLSNQARMSKLPPQTVSFSILLSLSVRCMANSSTRRLLRHRKRMPLLSHALPPLNLLLQKALSRHRHRSRRIRNRRHGLPSHGATTPPQSRISLDNASPGIHPARMPSHL